MKVYTVTSSTSCGGDSVSVFLTLERAENFFRESIEQYIFSWYNDGEYKGKPVEELVEEGFTDFGNEFFRIESHAFTNTEIQEFFEEHNIESNLMREDLLQGSAIEDYELE